MAMRWVCHLIDHHFCLKQLLKFRFQKATVLTILPTKSDSDVMFCLQNY